MKKIIYFSIVVLILIFILSISNNTLASENLEIKISSFEIIKDENFKIYINIGNIEVASYLLNINYDDNKVEYVNGPENTNKLDNRIISIWFDETGGNSPKINQEIAVFEFKAKEIGNIDFNIEGEFFDKNGNEIKINNQHINAKIVETNNEVLKNTQIQGEDNNSLLKIMRLDKEGIIPEFSPEIKDYYFIADSTINNLEVVAIPEATNAKVNINGNKNLKNGINKIEIEVTSRDGNSKNIYTINVSKTDDIEAANTNLETLAIEYVTLEPLFDTNVLNYKASVSNSFNDLNILAVPENINAKIEINGNKSLQIGDNLVTINVIAPDNFTEKVYKIIIHRRTEEEDKIFEDEQNINVEKLNSILEEQEINNNNDDMNGTNNSNVLYIVFGVIGVLCIIGIISLIVFKFRKKINNN